MCGGTLLSRRDRDERETIDGRQMVPSGLRIFAECTARLATEPRAHFFHDPIFHHPFSRFRL